ncbi:MAG: hypothetical protein Q9164_004054 [Protoblastenia rupestris]
MSSKMSPDPCYAVLTAKNSQQEASNLGTQPLNATSTGQNGHQPSKNADADPFINQIVAMDESKPAVEPLPNRTISFKLPEEKHGNEPSSGIKPRRPYMQLPPTQPYPSPTGTNPLIKRPITPLRAMPLPAAPPARHVFLRTPSYLCNPKGWSPNMTSVAVGELEDMSIEEVLEFMEEKYPKLKEVDGVREHLENLKIQFYG